jgi:hypothetical protein
MKKPSKISEKNKEIFYEDDVASWATTLLKKVFSGDEWIITPEKRNDETKKLKPDLTVEKFSQDQGFPEKTPVILMELKTLKGDRLENALHQTTKHIQSWMDLTGQIDLYIVIQKCTKIAFFEYHSNSDDVQESTNSAWGCTSLTQPLILNHKKHTVMENPPPDLELLFHDTENLTMMDDIREEAQQYKTPCVFDLDKHEKEIDFLFHHMSQHKPRQGPDEQDYPEEL